LATEVEEDSRYMIWKTRSARTNSHWLHVTPKTPLWRGRSREDLFPSNGVYTAMAPLPGHKKKKDNTDTTIKKEILN
jgi:hypothetical protein